MDHKFKVALSCAADITASETGRSLWLVSRNIFGHRLQCYIWVPSPSIFIQKMTAVITNLGQNSQYSKRFLHEHNSRTLRCGISFAINISPSSWSSKCEFNITEICSPWIQQTKLPRNVTSTGTDSLSIRPHRWTVSDEYAQARLAHYIR